jgi:hypothetical protein
MHFDQFERNAEIFCAAIMQFVLKIMSEEIVHGNVKVDRKQ